MFVEECINEVSNNQKVLSEATCFIGKEAWKKMGEDIHKQHNGNEEGLKKWMEYCSHDYDFDFFKERCLRFWNNIITQNPKMFDNDFYECLLLEEHNEKRIIEMW